MAFTVEDGTGVAEANAYIEVAYADTYFTDRAITAWTGASSVKQAAIIKATDYIETRWGSRFKGFRQFHDQVLSFPRLGLYDRAGNLVQGIPDFLKKAVSEYALRALSAPLMADLTTDASGLAIASKREKLGPLEEETTYQVGVAAQLKAYPAADRLLGDYVTSGGVAYR